MIVCGTVFFLFTVGFVLVQGILVGLYVRKMRQATSKKDDFQPSVAIVLCVRGLDPSLEDCLKALVAQDYRRKKIFVVGDHEQDHGLQLARKMSQQEPGLLSVHVNNEILQTCSVKCSHLISMTRQIESEFDLIALVDADTVPDESWLESMVQPFVDSDVNATTGVRWFSVGGKKWGSWVRYIWNTAAIVQMVCYRIPWGGSLALRSSFLREADVLDEWSRGFCEDTMLQKLSRRTGGRIEVVPEAVISSEEETSLARCIPWISRQLLTARLHHPRWPLVLAHGLATGLLRILDAVPDTGPGGQVDYCGKIVGNKQLFHFFEVFDIRPMKLEVLVRLQTLEPVLFYRHIVVVVNVIHANNAHSVLEPLPSNFVGNEPGYAC